MKILFAITTIWLASSIVFAIWWQCFFGCSDPDYTIKGDDTYDNDNDNDSQKP